MKNNVQIQKEIYLIKKRIFCMIENDHSLKSKKVLQLSQELDSIIVNCMKNNQNLSVKKSF